MPRGLRRAHPSSFGIVHLLTFVFPRTYIAPSSSKTRLFGGHQTCTPFVSPRRGSSQRQLARTGSGNCPCPLSYFCASHSRLRHGLKPAVKAASRVLSPIPPAPRFPAQP